MIPPVMRSFFSTIRFRITILYVLIFGVTLFVFSAILYFVHQHNLAADFDAALYNGALVIKKSISINVRGQLEIDQALIADSGRVLPFQFGNEFIEVRSPDGRSLAHSTSLGQQTFPLDSATLAALQSGRFVFQTIHPPRDNAPFWGQGDLRLISLPLIARGQIQLLLQLGVSTHAFDQSLSRLRTALFFIGIPLTLLLAGMGGWWLAGRAFRPINQVVAAAQRLGADHLNERLPVPKAEDEVRRLTVTLNEMLDRLEKAFQSQQRFVADASHELKTPITILMGELDVLRQQARSAGDYQIFLSSASEELQRLSQIIQNLLLLAQADSGKPLGLRDGVRLDEVVLGVVERLQPFVKRAQVQVRVNVDTGNAEIENQKSKIKNENGKEPLTVRGDADLLGSLFFNLIHNAIKYSSAGQRVDVQLEQTPSGPRVSVRDFGAGIRPEDLPRIFERFHRAENPTRRDVEGTGLGLTIARWIAEAHGARIMVESKPAEGSIFTVAFQSNRPLENTPIAV